jgi:hypothetical protein
MGMGTANVANCEHARLVLGSGGGACQNAEAQDFRNGHPADARHYMLSCRIVFRFRSSCSMLIRLLEELSAQRFVLGLQRSQFST